MEVGYCDRRPRYSAALVCARAYCRGLSCAAGGLLLRVTDECRCAAFGGLPFGNRGDAKAEPGGPDADKDGSAGEVLAPRFGKRISSCDICGNVFSVRIIAV